MKALFYFVHGFGWSYLADRKTRFTVSDWPQARPLQTVLGYSSSIVPVLITGKLPAHSGMWTEYYREDRHPSMLGTIARKAGRGAVPLNMARLVAFRMARKSGWPGAHRLRIPLELSHHFKRHSIDYMRMPPCELPVPTIVDVCKQHGLRMSFKFIGSEKTASDALESVRREREDIDVVFAYDCRVDHAGHAYGPDTAALGPYLDGVASTLGAIRDLAEPGGTLETLVFSDHGMTAVQRPFDIFGALRPLQIGRDFLAFPDSTFARFWYPSDRHGTRSVPPCATPPEAS